MTPLPLVVVSAITVTALILLIIAVLDVRERHRIQQYIEAIEAMSNAMKREQ